MRSRFLWMVLAMVVSTWSLSPALAVDDEPKETKEQRDERMKWWREAKFGMFIHWGLYAVPAGTYEGKKIGGIGEWIMHNGKIPVDKYAGYAKEFNPVKFNAEEWVKIAKDAGQKYLVITSKHHDGFAMYHSKVSPYNIVEATPYQRDPLKELAKACEKEGIKLGFYFSQAQDWHHPGGAAAGGHWDKAQDGSMDDFIDKVSVPQAREILTQYGKLWVLWWDTPMNMNKERAAKFLPLLKLQPGIIHNNRLGGGFGGDLETPEQYIPATGFPNRDWETCMTMNDTWGFKSYDHNWKSTKILLQNLIDIVSKGGNYLLNVGPTAEGEIPQPSVERLHQVGDWLRVNGEAIYATTASPFKKQLAWGRCTQKPGKLFFHVFSWPKNGELAIPIKNKVDKAYLLADRKDLKVKTEGEQVVVSLPENAPDPIATVIVLEIQGQADVVVPPVQPITPDKSGVLKLLPADAEIKGESLKVESHGGPANLGFWMKATDYPVWTVKLPEAGEFEIELTYALEPSSAGSEIAVQCGQAKTTGKLEATKSWKDYKTAPLGRIQLPAGTNQVEVRPIRKPGMAVMNLRQLSLRPVSAKTP